MRDEYKKYWYQQYRLQNSNGCSTYLFLIAFALFCLMFTGCRTKKMVTDENVTVSITDTTKTETDSLTQSLTLTDTTKTTETVQQSTTIVFVPDGGTVSIDSAGNVTLTGVQSITGNLKVDKTKQAGVTQQSDKTEVHGTQSNGIQANEQKQTHKESETKVEKPRWYESLMARIGGLCCFAVLLWALFLYLKRKF